MSPHARRAMRQARDNVLSWPHTFWRFWTAPVTDKPDHDLSLTRLLAIGLFVLVAHAIEASHSIGGNEVILLIVAMSAAFGKATFTFFLSKWSGKTDVKESRSDTTSTTTSVSVDEKITKDIQARTDPDRGFEATP